jgi:hypothetical protein
MALGPENARAKHNENAAGVGRILDGLIRCEEGRIFPAEQVEELRTAWEAVKDYRIDGYARPHVNRLVEVVGRLLPATEPAEDGWGDVNPNDPHGRTYRETSEEYYSVPAESQVTVEPVREIPYDEMRALLGLPDVSDYIMRRDLARAFGNMRTAFGGFAEVLVEAGQQFARNLESLTEVLAGAQPKPTPPMWAVDPARSRRRNLR